MLFVGSCKVPRWKARREGEKRREEARADRREKETRKREEGKAGTGAVSHPFSLNLSEGVPPSLRVLSESARQMQKCVVEHLDRSLQNG